MCLTTRVRFSVNRTSAERQLVGAFLGSFWVPFLENRRKRDFRNSLLGNALRKSVDRRFIIPPPPLVATWREIARWPFCWTYATILAIQELASSDLWPIPTTIWPATVRTRLMASNGTRLSISTMSFRRHSRSKRPKQIQGSQPRIDRFALQGQHAEHALVNSTKRLPPDEPFQGFDTEGEFSQGHRPRPRAFFRFV